MSRRNTLAAKAERRRARAARHERSRAVVGFTLARGMAALFIGDVKRKGKRWGS